MNLHDAKITSLYVSEPGPVLDIEDDAPNADTPAGTNFRVTLEMVAGGNVVGTYHLKTTCSDLTETLNAAAQAPPVGALNTPGGGHAFQTLPWAPDGTHWVFNQSALVPKPLPAKKGHVYRYTASLYSNNGQIVSIKQSDPFILL
jgi:hypothetical protein